MSMSREVRFVQFLGLGGFGRVSIIFVFELSLLGGGSANRCLLPKQDVASICICICICIFVFEMSLREGGSANRCLLPEHGGE